LLTGRDYSQAELRRRLLDKGFAPAGVDAALQRCLELGYLDDNRFALNRATSLMTQGRAVGQRILLDLRQRGISEDVACQALAKACEDCDESTLLRSLLQRRFPDFNYSSAPAKERRRVVHFLQRRGFAIGRIMDQLTRKGFETHDENG
jgi:regulatory protein